jgi:hypothetical protein
MRIFKKRIFGSNVKHFRGKMPKYIYDEVTLHKDTDRYAKLVLVKIGDKDKIYGYVLIDDEDENRKLHYGEPCSYLDSRIYQDDFVSSSYFTRYRKKKYSKKQILNILDGIYNVDKGAYMVISSNQQLVRKSTNEKKRFKLYHKPSYKRFRFRNDLIQSPAFTSNFKNDEKANELITKLRAIGFVCKIQFEKEYIYDLEQGQTEYNGRSITSENINENLTLNSIEVECAVCYGMGIRIGISENKFSLFGYSNGCDNILFDKYDYFNKWSQCEEISKDNTIDEIITKLIDFSKKNEH